MQQSVVARAVLAGSVSATLLAGVLVAASGEAAARDEGAPVSPAAAVAGEAAASAYSRGVSTRGAAGVLRHAGRLGNVHHDVPADGALTGRRTSTAELYADAGVAYGKGGRGGPGGGGGTTSTSSTRPTVKGLRSHVDAACTGTGTDGNRVQPLYLREASTPSRLTDVRPLLLNELQNVDDVVAVSSRKTGGDLRVRWVQQSCQPVVEEAVVPDGTLASGFWPTVAALQALGYEDQSRKYLAFADVAGGCGIATVYRDDGPTDNLSDNAVGYARVDTACWSGTSSIPAHELVHTLGGVQVSSPHATPAGHCTDDGDLMCYVDGPGTVVSRVCASGEEQLLDCREDDYFHSSPPAGSYLDTHWNTARSSFLQSAAP